MITSVSAFSLSFKTFFPTCYYLVCEYERENDSNVFIRTSTRTNRCTKNIPKTRLRVNLAQQTEVWNYHPHEWKRHMEFLLITILGVWNLTRIILETQMIKQMYAACNYVNSDTNRSWGSHLKLLRLSVWLWHLMKNEFQLQRKQIFIYEHWYVYHIAQFYTQKWLLFFILNTYWLFIMCQALLSMLYYSSI